MSRVFAISAFISLIVGAVFLIGGAAGLFGGGSTETVFMLVGGLIMLEGLVLFFARNALGRRGG